MIRPKVGEANSVLKSVPKTNVKAASKKVATRVSVSRSKPPSFKKVIAPKKTNIKTEAVKHLNVRQIEEDTRKIEIIENISRKKPKVPVISKASTPNPALTLLGSQLRIALMSPFNMKFDHAQAASNVARYAGTAFVVVGAFLTLHNMNAVATYMSVPPDSLRALTGTTSSSTLESYDSTLNQTIDQTPDVSISIESPNNTIAGTVVANVTVPIATRVDLVAKNLATNQSQTIGVMMRVSDLVWRTYWQTSGFQDGKYRLRAVVTNQFGTYTHDSTTDYSVVNQPVNDSLSTDTTITNTSGTSNNGSTTTQIATSTGSGTADTEQTATTTTTITTTSLPPVRVEIAMEEPLHDTANIRTFVMGATSVQHYIRKKGTTNNAALGSANLYSAGAGEWRFSFNTIPLIDGDYDLLTKAFFTNNTHNSKILENLTIKNSDMNAVSPDTTDSESDTLGDIIDPLDTDEIDTKIYFEFTKQNPMSGLVDVYMQVEKASFIELYIRPEGSLMHKYLGLGMKQTESTWKYRLDTTSLPNGNYGFFTKVRSLYGDSTSEPVPILIKNVVSTVTLTPEKQTYIDTLKSVGEESKVILANEPIRSVPQPENDESDQLADPTVNEVSRYSDLAEDVGEQYTDEVTEILEEFNVELIRIMSEVGRAMRESDEEKARKLLGELEILRDEVIRSLPYDEDQSEALGKIRNYMESVMKDIRERTEKSETLIKERVGDAALRDSDSDGVSDYDEVNIYSTDPMSADTDKDGYIDGIEILNGYNPKNSEREASVIYESPKEQGIVRDDILQIAYITTVVDELDGKEQIKAQIGGKALPNSFVTVYIFSTPIVVTLKTDDEGNWSYIFDKELEDGDHEIYVGMTDNAGKIVAKSSPLPFIKTAEAFTPIDASGAMVSADPIEPTLLSNRALLAIASIAVLALGLVLILLGLHVRPKEQVPQLA